MVVVASSCGDVLPDTGLGQYRKIDGIMSMEVKTSARKFKLD